MPCVCGHKHRADECPFNVPDSLLIDFSGNSWCPFHLPFMDGAAVSGKAAWDEEACQALHHALRAFVNKARVGGSLASLSAVAIPGEISFEMPGADVYQLPPMNLNRAHFGGDADFIEARFEGRATFTDAVFEGDADFALARFEGLADFSGAHFKGAFDASEARFLGPALFKNAVFDGPVYFRETQFATCPDFEGASFKTPPSFATVAVPEGCFL